MSLSVGLGSCTNDSATTPSHLNFHLKKSEIFFNNLRRQPENLHPIRSTDYYSAVIHYHVLESLLQRNENTYEWEPQLAQKWRLAPHGNTMTFELKDNLKWSDGKPLTVQDVQFSFEAHKNPEYGGLQSFSKFENMKSIKILSDKKIQFKIKRPYFGSLQVIANMKIIPQHIYKNPESKLSKTLMGSGPYALSGYAQGKFLFLKKNVLWTNRTSTPNHDKWSFPAIAFRFVPTEADVLLNMEKELLDFSTLSASAFLEKTNHAPWGKKIKKVKYQKKQPSGYNWIGLNLRKTIFQDKKVRKALAHLFHRKLMNEKFHYNEKELARGPWYFWSDYADKSVKAIEFNPKEAKKLLKDSGWKDQDQNGILEKKLQGQAQELNFTLLFSHVDSEKYLTIYKEDLKKAGIELHLKRIDWPSFLSLVRDKKFEAMMIGHSDHLIDLDPKPRWHTASSRKGGGNIISYSNPQVDALIDQGCAQLSKKDRIQTFKKVYKIIAEDVPGIFIFNTRSRFYGLNQRIRAPSTALNYGYGMSEWRFKEEND